MSAIEHGCPCGVAFVSRKASSRYCSNKCKYRYRVRPSGLSYTIVSDNPGWFGRHRPVLTGAAAPGWKGDAIGYGHLHDWVQKVKGPYPDSCERCGRSGYVEWANVSHEYRRDPADWAAFCRQCHRRHDSGEVRGAAVRKFGRAAINGRAAA